MVKIFVQLLSTKAHIGINHDDFIDILICFMHNIQILS